MICTQVQHKEILLSVSREVDVRLRHDNAVKEHVQYHGDVERAETGAWFW